MPLMLVLLICRIVHAFDSMPPTFGTRACLV
jgi:hypothetical protein